MPLKIIQYICLILSISYPPVTSMGCATVHPQEKYCTSTIAFTGRVTHIEWVHISTMTHITQPPEDPSSQSSMTSQSPGPTTRATATVNETASEGSPEPEIIPHLQLADAGVDLVQELQGYGVLDPIKTEPWNYEIQYSVEVSKIYKESERFELRKGAVVQLQTSSFYLAHLPCGHGMLRLRKTYLFAVANPDEISQCDWVEEYKDLTRTQKQGLKSNYRRGCEQCKINLRNGYTWQTDPRANNAMTCTQDIMAGTCFSQYCDEDCIGMYSHCAYRNGRCMWYKTKEYKSCSKSGQDRRTRSPNN